MLYWRPRCPFLRGLVLRELLGRPLDDPDVTAAKAAIANYPPLARLLAAARGT